MRQKRRGIITAGTAILLVLVVAAPSFAAGGDLDTSWDGDGIVTTSFGADYSFADGVVTKDGITVAVGGWDDGNDGDFAIARYLKNGALDTSFGGDGKVTTEFNDMNDLATAAAFQGEKLVVVGYADGDASFDGAHIALARYLKDGSLDPTFGGDGKVTTDIPATNYDAANTVDVDGDKVLIGGASGNGGGANDFVLARYLKNGSLDPSFDTDGVVVTDLGGNDSIGDVTRSGDKIVAAGYSNAGGDNDFVVAEYSKKNGALESSFGSGGVVFTDFGSGDDVGTSVDLDGNRIVVGGWASNGANDDFAAARYDKNGALDLGFNGTGMATLDLAGDDDHSFGVAVGPGDAVVLGGERYNDGDFAAARFTKNGLPDAAFGGGDGWTSTHVTGSTYSDGLAMTLGPDNRIVLAGYSDNDFAVVRYLYK